MICKKCKRDLDPKQFFERSPGKLRKSCKECGSLAAKTAHKFRKLLEKQIPESKCCKACNEVKTSGEFGRAACRLDGLSSKCKKCASKYRKQPHMLEYYAKRKNNGKQAEILRKYRNSHKSEMVKKRNERRAKHGDRLRIREKELRKQARNQALCLLGGMCSVCGETEPSFLAIDHVFNDGSTERLTTGEKQLVKAIIAKRVDADRYQILCFNHNKQKQLDLLSSRSKNDSPSNKSQRKCSQCKTVKLIGEFVKDKYKSSGRKSECKECSSARGQKLKAKIVTMLGGACKCCGCDDAKWLEVDHIHNDGAKRRRSGADDGLYLKIARGEAETDRLQLLCANCNMSKALNNGKCAHNR